MQSKLSLLPWYSRWSAGLVGIERSYCNPRDDLGMETLVDLSDGLDVRAAVLLVSFLQGKDNTHNSESHEQSQLVVWIVLASRRLPIHIFRPS